MPKLGGRRRTRRHNHHHRRRGATPERADLPRVVLAQQVDAQPVEAEAEEEEFRRRLHDWVADGYVTGAYAPLAEATRILNTSMRELTEWLGDAAGRDGGDVIIDENLSHLPLLVKLRVAPNAMGDTDLETATIVYHDAELLRDQAKWFDEKSKKMMAEESTSSPKVEAPTKLDFVLAILTLVAIAYILWWLAPLFFWLIRRVLRYIWLWATLCLRIFSHVLGLLDILATFLDPILPRAYWELAGHVVACRIANWTGDLTLLVTLMLDDLDRRTDSLWGTYFRMMIYG
ncbi:hypothetical protein PG988_011892 [Apiospora saccharicola]